MKNIQKIFIEQITGKTDRFKDNFSFEKRLVESTRIMKKYPDRVPIICEKAKMCSDKAITNLDTSKDPAIIITSREAPANNFDRPVTE